MINLKVSAPQSASKRITITQYENKRKVQISTNLFPLCGFEKGVPVIETALGQNLGYIVELATPGIPYNNVKRIYERSYKTRRSNPLETYFETSSKKILDNCIPKLAKMVHVTLVYGKMIVIPILDYAQEQLSKLSLETKSDIGSFQLSITYRKDITIL
ncbi:hypothetical protein HNW13_018390 [Shewanella sp. BF02_Schw]|uniref:hypothetical protein n=1 Tax=Shewanella sp. BF02_Schw TaxID=394908 RepID=UPI00177E22E1|nr:hypothetical protein [Shewanella sp. BF02_Schw]MBO1897711.1 hypothetical protein [Shewanella sp. BF02_Schw]